jgi:hypothetical protein
MDDPNKQQQAETDTSTDVASPDHLTQPPVQPVGEQKNPEEEKSSVGSVVGIVVIIAVILFAGLYLWGGKLIKSDGDLETDATATEISSASDPALNALQNQSSSDEVSDIENDLENTDVDTLLDGIDDIDAVLSL